MSGYSTIGSVLYLRYKVDVRSTPYVYEYVRTHVHPGACEGGRDDGSRRRMRRKGWSGETCTKRPINEHRHPQTSTAPSGVLGACGGANRGPVGSQRAPLVPVLKRGGELGSSHIHIGSTHAMLGVEDER